LNAHDGSVSPAGCVVTGTLPNGMSIDRSLDGTSCEISGTPDTIQPSTPYTVTLTNVTDSVAVTFNIAVVSGTAAIATPAAFIFTDGTAINPQPFANTNSHADAGPVTACATAAGTTMLPAGLTIAAQPAPGTLNPVGPEGNGCFLAGTPMAPTAQAVYTITVTTDNGPSTLELDITVNPAAPMLEMAIAQTFPTGLPATVRFVNNGGGMLNDDSGCVLTDGSLPDGFTLSRSADESTCVLSGTPMTPQGPREITVAATNVTDRSTATVSIEIVSGVATFAMPEALILTDGLDIGNRLYANTNTDGTRVTACTAATAPDGTTPVDTTMLPAGLSITAQTDPANGCVLTGTPNTPTAQGVYTVAVTNDNGPSTLMLDITVNPAAPMLVAPAAQVYATGAATSLTLTSTGGAMLNAHDGSVSPAGCVVTGTLPNGMSIDRSLDGTSCEISGT
ncbi:MAG: putative Ig domain-containing protein, partial [Proteobacteria bacterium]|nr:putative Ig domain-containing protein [Pseudomonadota bacterium]